VVEFPKEETLTKEQKLEQFKRRMNFRSILRKGDFYSIKNMKETALQYYLNAYKKLPNDHIIEKKIAETYFEMKNFEKSYAYYKRMPS
jgi:tetratricopeptide (TPR) repeat protein